MPEELTFWQQVQQRLAPLTEWIPEDYRGMFPVEVWWLIQLVVVLFVLLVIGRLLRGVLRGVGGLFVRKKKYDYDRALIVNLPAEEQMKTPPSVKIRQEQGWLRVVVVAPVDKNVIVDENVVDWMLERVIPGLRDLMIRDQPEVVIWPAQLSTMGFSNTFHRCIVTGFREDEMSPWVLLAGRAQGGGQTLFVGLAFRTARNSSLGRMNLQPDQWLDVIKM